MRPHQESREVTAPRLSRPPQMTLVLRTAIAPPVWRGALWLTRLVCRVRNPLCIYCARYLHAVEVLKQGLRVVAYNSGEEVVFRQGRGCDALCQDIVIVGVDRPVDVRG